MKNIKGIIAISICCLSFCATGQDFDGLMNQINYVPRLIQEGYTWSAIADSIQVNFPNQALELSEIQKTETCLATNCMDEESMFLTSLFDTEFQNERFKRTVFSLGDEVLSVLIKHLDDDFATRWIVANYEWDEPGFYLCLSDVSMKMIESITGIYFFNSSVNPNRRFSKAIVLEKQEVITTIKLWYEKTKGLNKIERINYYLNNFEINKYGSRINTAQNLAQLGDTINAINQLEILYDDYKLPCRSNMLIANIVNDLGKDIALSDCLHDIYDYRCMADNGINCVDYILQNAKSHIPYDVLADVVSTERFSRYKRRSNKFIWHYIFNHMASEVNPWAESILLELLSIDQVVVDSDIIAYQWQRLYPEQFEKGFRVCDFALLKLTELNPELEIQVDWNDLDIINNEIERIKG